MRRFLIPILFLAAPLAFTTHATGTRAFRHIGSFRGKGRFLGWLFRIAY